MNKIKTIVVTLALLAGSLFVAAPAGAVGTQNQWQSWWTHASAPAKAFDASYNGAIKVLQNGTPAQAEVALKGLSIASVNLAAQADSPGPKTNRDLLLVAQDGNTVAWTAYTLIITNGTDLNGLKLDVAELRAAENEFGAAVKARA